MSTIAEEIISRRPELGGIMEAAEVKQLIHIEGIRKTTRNQESYLKENRQGMVDHLSIQLFDVAEVTAIIFSLWILT